MGKGPGKYYRKGISLLDLTKRFPKRRHGGRLVRSNPLA